jgi:hypothetical protein
LTSPPRLLSTFQESNPSKTYILPHGRQSCSLSMSWELSSSSEDLTRVPNCEDPTQTFVPLSCPSEDMFCTPKPAKSTEMPLVPPYTDKTQGQALCHCSAQVLDSLSERELSCYSSSRNRSKQLGFRSQLAFPLNEDSNVFCPILFKDKTELRGGSYMESTAEVLFPGIFMPIELGDPDVILPVQWEERRKRSLHNRKFKLAPRMSKFNSQRSIGVPSRSSWV